MIYLLDALLAIALLALLIWGAQTLLRRVRETRELRRARWAPRVRSLANNQIAVQVERPGEESQVVAALNPAAQDFEHQLYEAEARAEELAATLNAADRR